MVTHSNLHLKPGDLGMAVADLWRIADGKIVEHWDVVQEVPQEKQQRQRHVLNLRSDGVCSGSDTFHAPRPRESLSPSKYSMTTIGEQVIHRFVATLNERDFDRFEALFADDYKQHRALATNSGSPAAKDCVRVNRNLAVF